jgi:cytochrome c peroxidase
MGGRESSWGANRRGALLAAAVLAFGGAALVVRRELKSAPRDPGADVRRLMLAQADSLDASLSALSRVLAAVSPDRSTSTTGDQPPPPAVRDAFRHARAQYKHLEAAIEFYAPALAAAFNSRRQEVDDDDAPPPSFLAPSGFPALETVLWTDGGLTRSRVDSARKIVAGMRPLVGQVRGLATGIQPTDAQVIEFTRLELVRITTLGIAGFDAPRSRDAMLESAEALDGVRQTYLVTGHRWPATMSQRRRLDVALAAAADYLRSHTDFAAFDRLGFIVGQANAAAEALEALRIAEGTIPISMPRGLRAGAVSPYAADAFDERAYAPRSAPSGSRDLIDLGGRLFTDPRLSGPATRSCASCHNPSHAFTDGRSTPASLAPGLPVPRNTPTLTNVGFQPAQFADERAVTLEDQVVEVLRSRAEMASSIDSAAARLAGDPSYREQFARAFGDAAGGGGGRGSTASVTPLRVRQAIAAFERSLVGMNSRFDQAVRGDSAAITRQEREGFNLFMGKAGCGSCHFAPLFGGATPPRYVASDVEVIGTPAAPGSARFDADSGRGAIDHRVDHIRAFKVPSLRNVAITAPYMHNGTFLTLRQVMDFYEGGGAQGRLPNQTLALDSLHLTPSERDAVIAFLQTLTDSSVRPDPVKMKVPGTHPSP